MIQTKTNRKLETLNNTIGNTTLKKDNNIIITSKFCSILLKDKNLSLDLLPNPKSTFDIEFNYILEQRRLISSSLLKIRFIYHILACLKKIYKPTKTKNISLRIGHYRNTITIRKTMNDLIKIYASYNNDIEVRDNFDLLTLYNCISILNLEAKKEDTFIFNFYIKGMKTYIKFETDKYIILIENMEVL
jgi:hypothetical protein